MTSAGSEAKVRFEKKKLLLPQCLLNFVIENKLRSSSKNGETDLWKVRCSSKNFNLFGSLPLCCLSEWGSWSPGDGEKLSGALRINNLEGQRNCSTLGVCAFIRSRSKRLLMSSVGVWKSVSVCAWFRWFFLSQWAVKIRVCPVNLCQPKTHLLWVPLSTTLHLTSTACVCVCLFFFVYYV